MRKKSSKKKDEALFPTKAFDISFIETKEMSEEELKPKKKRIESPVPKFDRTILNWIEAILCAIALLIFLGLFLVVFIQKITM